MTGVVGAIAPIFLLIVAGYVLKRRGFPGDGFWAPAERLSYFVFLPALIMHSLIRADLAGIRIDALAIAIVSMALGTTVIAAVAHPFLRLDGAAFTSVYQGVIRLNAYIGFAFASAFYGEAGLAVAAVFVAIMMPTANALCVAVLVKYGAGGRPSWWGVVVGIAKNPLILACVAGAGLNPFAAGIPDWTIGVLGILAPTALPIALLCVGAGLVFSALRSRHWIIITTSAYKLVLLPLIAWQLVAVMGLPPLASAIVILFAATPVSPSTYVLARQMGGDADLMAGIITAQTALSMISISVVLILLGGATPG